MKPGDPILRLVQFDKLRVECFVPPREYDPVDLANRPVTVRAHLARGRAGVGRGPRRVRRSDRADWSDYRVRAEVENQREGDFWLLRPGLRRRDDDSRERAAGRRAEPKTRGRSSAQAFSP